MSHEVDFEEILALFRLHGYELKLIWPKGIWGDQDYAVFKSGKPLDLPWLVPLGDNGKVAAVYEKKFKEFLKERGEI